VHAVGAPDAKGRVAVRITELPPNVKSNDLKVALHAMDGVVDVVPHSKKDTVDLEVVFADAKSLPADVPKKLRLVERVSLANMHLFDEAGTLTRYESAAEIVRAHAAIRLRWYEARLAKLVELVREKLARCRTRARLVRAVLDGEIRLVGARKADLVAALGEQDAGTLLGLGVDALTEDAVAAREAEAAKWEAEIARLQAATPAGEWCKDLDAVEAALGRPTPGKRARDDA